MKYVVITLILAALAWTGFSVTKEMKRYELFCLYRTLPKGDHFSGSYVVSGYNEKGMALQIFSPTNELIQKIEREKEGKFGLQTSEEGEYRACFRNLEKDLAYISFEVSALETDNKGKVVSVGEITTINNRLREAVRNVRRIRTNLSFQEMRERVHNKNLEELSSKIKWSAFFKILVLAGIGAGQVYLLTNFFKKKEKIRV